MGKSLGDKRPRASHAAWKRAVDRPDPIVLLEESNKGRIPELIPVRYGRMLVSPFTWYRGAALNMAADLAATPTSGLRVQCCGDAHLCNFGAFATPERRVIHARSGEPAKISGYLGKSDTFDEAIADFSIAYADQSEQDHEIRHEVGGRGETGSVHRHQTMTGERKTYLDVDIDIGYRRLLLEKTRENPSHSLWNGLRRYGGR